MPRIFISYRRQDSYNFTGRIHDRLVREFGDRSVFRDVYDIPAGSDFRTILNKEVSKGDIFLAIIGPQWVDITDSQGNRRLDDPNDYVRIEVESALNNPKTLVIPVLVDNASMPAEQDLPESLRELCYRNAVRVRTDPDFPRDMELLTRQIKSLKSSSKMRRLLTVIGLAFLLIAGTLLFPQTRGFFKGISLINPEIPFTTEPQTEEPLANENTKTPTKQKTATATIIQTEKPVTNESDTTPIPLVEPVEPGQIMVLVAQFEPIGSQERDVTRFIVDDLRQHFEVELPFTNIGVREYKEIITSSSEALQIAEQAQAVIVIWGNYDEDSVTANVQLGSLESRSDLVFERDILERMVNVRVRIINERQETLANQVLSSLAGLYTAENDVSNASFLFMAIDMLGAPSPEMIGISIATHVHKAAEAFLSDNQLAIEELNQAIELDAGNPLLYSFRGWLRQRTGNFDFADQDLNTALLLAPEGWVGPYLLKGNRSLIELDPAVGIENYSKVIETISDDWLAYNNRGYFYFLAKDYELAREDIEKSIELGPETEWPYMWSTLIALRQGRIEDASDSMKLLTEDPNPTLVVRFMTTMFGEHYAHVLGSSMAAIGHLSLRQYDAAIQDTDTVLSMVPAYPEMNMLRGLSYCNLDDYANAEDSYTQGITRDPSFTVLYLLRAEMRSKLGDVAGAGEDLAAVQQSDLAEILSPYLDAAESGEFSCKQVIATK